MATIENSVVINRPIEEVFAVLSNPENGPKWRSNFTEAKLMVSGPVGKGTTFRAVLKFLGQSLESVVECIEYEPNRKISWQTKSGPAPLTIHITLEPAGGSTRLHQLGKIEPGGLFKLAEPVFANLVQRQAETDLHTLKDLMEARAL